MHYESFFRISYTQTQAIPVVHHRYAMKRPVMCTDSVQLIASVQFFYVRNTTNLELVYVVMLAHRSIASKHKQRHNVESCPHHHLFFLPPAVCVTLLVCISSPI